MFFTRLTQKHDEELMAMIQRGHQSALTELYNRYSKPMLRYFFRMLWKDENKAQDFLHDLFVKIIEKPEYYNSERKFSTWIYSVAHNMCKNEYRKQNYREAFMAVQREEVVESRLEETLDEKRFSHVLTIAMDEWPEEDKTLFVLRHELEMTFAEIGAIIDCPEGTAKSRWFYLRKKLAEKFQEFESLLK